MEALCLIFSALSCGGMVSIFLHFRARDQEAQERDDAIRLALEELREQLAKSHVIPIPAYRLPLPLALPKLQLVGDQPEPDQEGDREAMQGERKPVPLSFDTVPCGHRVESSYYLLCAESEAHGKPATHCEGVDCWHGGKNGVCLCWCPACHGSTSVLIRAYNAISQR